MTVWSILMLILVIAPIGTIIHEIGHLLGAILVKADHLELGIGSGKQLKKISFKKINVNIHLFIFFGGYSEGDRGSPFNRIEKAIIALSGPLLNAIIASTVNLFWSIDDKFFSIFMLYNWWLAIINIIPFTWNGRHSDGYSVLKVIFIKDF